MRSNDVYRGLPYNIVQFTTLQEVMAGWLGLELGEYNQISNSLHVYERDLERVKSISPTPSAVNSDSLMFSKKESDEYFHDLSDKIEAIIGERISTDTLLTTVRQSRLPGPFRNMLCVLCAEGARRRHQEHVINDLMLDCTNPAYKQLYDRWLIRCGVKKASIRSAAMG
jgi:thymidylate synthase